MPTNKLHTARVRFFIEAVLLAKKKWKKSNGRKLSFRLNNLYANYPSSVEEFIEDLGFFTRNSFIRMDNGEYVICPMTTVELMKEFNLLTYFKINYLEYDDKPINTLYNFLNK